MTTTIKGYEQLYWYLGMFKKQDTHMLLLGASGTGKSESAKMVVPEAYRIKTHTSPLALYAELYFNRDQPAVIFDDVISMLNQKENIAIIMSLSDSTETREIHWHSTSKILKQLELEQSFETKTKALVIANEISLLEKKIKPIFDRMWVVSFEPAVSEVMNKIREISSSINNGLNEQQKNEIIDLIETYSKAGNATLRTFVKGIALYKECKGKDWEEKLLAEMQVEPKMQQIGQLIERFGDEKTRLEIWQHKVGSRRDYYRWKGKFLTKCQSAT